MTDTEIIELIGTGERPGVEFKNARARTDPSFKEVVKAVLGMANRRDGGLIVVGVEDNGQAPGIGPAQVASWQNPDHVRQSVAPYAAPHVYLEVEVRTIAEAGPFQNRTFVVLAVQEFDDEPVLCAKSEQHNGQEYLRVGACYVRPNHMPATTEIANHAQFRQLLDLAIEKGVRKFLKKAKAVGLDVDAIANNGDADQNAFDAQIEAFDE